MAALSRLSVLDNVDGVGTCSRESKRLAQLGDRVDGKRSRPKVSQKPRDTLLKPSVVLDKLRLGVYGHTYI